MSNLRPLADSSIAAGMIAAFELLKIVPPAKVDCSRPPLDPAGVPACMRPDCTLPMLDHAISTSHLIGLRPDPREMLAPSRAERLERAQRRREAHSTEKNTSNNHGRSSSAVERSAVRTELGERVAPAGISDGASAIAQVRILPPASPAKSTNWIADRFQRIAGAIAFLKSQGILVTVVDRDAPVRDYYVSGKRYRQLAEEVVEIAIANGWVE